MGGNALKLPTRRLEAEVYHPLANMIVSELAQLVGSRAETLRAYNAKEDFGDMDVLVDREAVFSLSNDPQDPWQGVLDWAAGHGAVEFVRTNGPSLCFGVPLDDGAWFPVELMATPLEDFQTCRDYYAYNDLGNLIGRVAHKMGMKFGHLGLLYPLRDGAHLLAELVVTRDTRQALEFMGYDFDRWDRGFDQLTDIFEFAASTPYFNPEAFTLENLNHRNRTRNRKRKTFMEFLSWLDNDGFQGTAYEFPEDKTVWLPKIRQTFPQFAQQMDLVLAKHENKKDFKTKFNGTVLACWTGLEGQKLGQAMACVRRELGDTSQMAQLFEQLGEQGFKDKALSTLGPEFLTSPPRPRLK